MENIIRQIVIRKVCEECKSKCNNKMIGEFGITCLSCKCGKSRHFFKGVKEQDWEMVKKVKTMQFIIN